MDESSQPDTDDPPDVGDPEQCAADTAYGRRVLQAELEAIRDMLPRVDERLGRAVQQIVEATGRVVVTGVGKSGLIGQKISATMASTGTPSLFLHSGEAVHGDMGRVLHEDVVLALSYSGTTDEVIRLVPIIKKIGAGLISITSRADSALGQSSDVCLPVGRIEEACPIGLAPTSSTTAMLALGDALAMAVAHRKSFRREDFALFHPGGSLGRSLATVGEVMRPSEEVTTVPPGTTVADALREMSTPNRPRSGALLIAEPGGPLVGILTDGDLRRGLLAQADLLSQTVASVMTRSPKVARTRDLLAETFRRIKEHQIDEIPVVDDAGRVIGLLDVQDVVEWGVAL